MLTSVIDEIKCTISENKALKANKGRPFSFSVLVFDKGSAVEVRYFHRVSSLVSPAIFVADFPHPVGHFLQDELCLRVEKTLEDKYSNSLETGKDSEGVGNDQIVESQEEEAGDPAASQETHEYPHTLHVGDEKVGVPPRTPQP